MKAYVTETIVETLAESVHNVSHRFLEEVAIDILLTLQNEGFVLVPINATDEMIEAGKRELPPHTRWVRDAWLAMVKANPCRLGDDKDWDTILKMLDETSEEDQ